MGSLSRKKVENHKLESQTTKPSLALNPGRSSFCKVSLSAICSDKKLKFDASALKAFYIRNLNLVNSFDTKLFFCKPEACLEGKKTNLQYCCMLFVTFLCRNQTPLFARDRDGIDTYVYQSLTSRVCVASTESVSVWLLQSKERPKKGFLDVLAGQKVKREQKMREQGGGQELVPFPPVPLSLIFSLLSPPSISHFFSLPTSCTPLKRQRTTFLDLSFLS